jgi:hypothetical protein
MTTYISAELRRMVIQRGQGCCEYCRMSAEDRFLAFEIDHVVSEKHGGLTVAENLCLACYRYNGLKGTDIAGADPNTGRATFLFNPRTQIWAEHFVLDQAHIQPLSPEGRLTVFLLRLNASIQLEQRTLLISLGRYPCVTDQANIL